METLQIVLAVALIVLSAIMTVVILMQEGKSAGLGTIAGAADTFWQKNKGRSVEGRLVLATKIGVALILILSIVLNLGIW
ncbi:preprotein translocase subunit SecG [Lachnospiraceae bacterium C7]|nr:preprotein translocase subunit SecG [Lachnospiraceae bacterium C7]